MSSLNEISDFSFGQFYTELRTQEYGCNGIWMITEFERAGLRV